MLGVGGQEGQRAMEGLQRQQRCNIRLFADRRKEAFSASCNFSGSAMGAALPPYSMCPNAHHPRVLDALTKHVNLAGERLARDCAVRRAVWTAEKFRSLCAEIRE